MNYCSLGDKPTLNYQFTGQAAKVIKFSFSPIDVAVVNTFGSLDTGNYSPTGYGLSVYSPNDQIEKGYIVTDYYVEDRGIPAQTFDYRYNFILHGKQCGSSEYTGLSFIDPQTIVIDNNTKCPVPETSAMRIQVSYENKIIFKESHNSSVSFSVACGDCPEGFCKCPIPGYPGYCCLDCSATAASIRAITNELRNKNG